ncbi:MAG TPA: tetraacyldisaccharide 4'-kinase, partial [Cytophagaceae bacterium]
NLSINYKVLNSYRLPDHHSYTLKDISAIKDLYKNQQAKNPALITTEKDMVKLIAFKEALETLPLFYIPIAVYFLKDSEKEMFDQKIRSYLDQKLE